MPFNDLERIKNNQELYGDISTDDEAMILADNSLSTEEKNVAVLSPDTYKQKKKQYSVEDEMAKYPALFSNLKIPSMYAMTAAHKDELKKYEDEFYAESKKQGALANAWNSFWYSRKAMEISALDADRMDAIRDNDEAKLAEIDNKIKVAREELSQMDAPTDEDSVSGAIGAIGASLVRNLPELIASGVVTTGLASLAGISGGTSLAGAAVSGGRFVSALSKIRGGYNAVRAARAMKFANVSNEVIGMGIIYNDTANVERGAAYRELSEQHPEMSEEERQEKAWLIGRVNGGIEAATAGAFGLAARGFATVARPAQRALARKLLTNETATTALKNATYDAIDAGILDAAKATDSRFISKLAGNLKAVLENPKVALGKEVIDYSMEGYTEIFQDAINKTVAEWDESEQGDLTAGSALGDAWSRVNEGFVELYNYVVNDGSLSDETRQMFRKFGSIGVASALFGRTGHYVGEAFNRIGRDKVSNPATQLEAANTTISKLDRVLEQKKNSALYGKSPEAANEFYNNVAKSGNLPKTISIDENKLKELIEESKSDPVIQAQIARANLGEKLKTAEAGMVEMEFQEFNQAFLDPNNDTLYQKIKNDITENPAMMTKNESIAWLKGILENDENIVEAQKDKNSLYNRVYEISKKNGAEDELATAQAIFAQNAFSAMGRFGLSPKDAEAVAQEIGLRFEVEQRPEGILSRLTKKVKEAFTGKSGFVTDQSKAYARMIFEDELAALNKKKQAKLKEGKDVVQEETRIKELEAMLGDEGEIKTTEAQENFIRAIEAKDIDTLADIMSKNRQAKKFFESLEGVKLPSTKSGIAETLGNWARVDVAGEIGNVLYQTAFHGSPNKKLEGGKFDLKYAGKTTGTVHGYGVYAVVSKSSAEYWAGENGQVYELDVPEDFNLIDEQKRFSEQPENVQWAILRALERINGAGLLSKAIEEDYYGGDIYTALGKDVYMDKHRGVEGGSTDVKIAASEFLSKIGIKGITYEYANEKNFVIFNPDDVRIIQTFYQYVGPRALTANLDELARAEDMLAQGKSMAEILKETGWFKDSKDQKWKFEISDKDAEIIVDTLQKLFSNKIKSVKLKDILKHDKLYKAYPELAETEVRYNSRFRTSLGEFTYFKLTGKMLIQLKKTDDYEALKETLLHEIQHNIQKVEGFAKGGEPKGYSTPLPEHLWQANRERNALGIGLWEEMKKAGITPSDDRVTVSALLSAIPQFRKIAAKDEGLQRVLSRFEELNKQLKKYDEGSSFGRYLRLPGENEARDTSITRLNLTEEERREKLPASLTGEFAPTIRFNIGDEITEVPVQEIGFETGVAGSTTFTPTETILRLSKISNPTTFIHEVGHIFIKQLLDMYNKGQLNPVWQKKAEDFIEFCGFEKDERGVIMAGEKYVAAQEKFADAMMTYFWEGKAPKPYLKAMFDAIAEWFADFYNMMKMSPLGLTPKVREAFDAIFTPYEEQKALQAEKKLGFLPKPDGMSDAQYQQYIAEKRALTSYSATEEIKAAAKVAKLKTEKVYQEEYEASLNEAYQDLGKLPVYQMIEDIQVNKILAGTLNLPKGMALRKEFVSSQKGAAVQEVLAMYKNLVSTEEELVRILNETPSRSAAAQYIAEKHMNEWLRENYPTTENLNAEFAEKNERAVRLATMEYMMLAGIDMKNFSLEYNSILAAGEELVQTMPMNKAVNVERWLEMENKILQKYEYAKTDKERARLKRLQAVISFYAMRSKDIRTDYRKFSKKVRKYRKDPDSSGLRQMTGATWDLLKTILYNYNFTQSKPRSKETLLEKMTNLQMTLLNEGFTSADVLDNYKYSLPQDKIDHKIEYGEFSKMTEIFSLVEGMGYAQKQVVVNGKRINIENAADDLIDYMQRENIKPVNERSTIGKGFDNWMIPEALLKEIMPQKVYLDYIAPHMKGIAERDNQIRTWQNRQAELLKLYNGDYTEKVEIGGRVYTILDLLVIMLNSGNNHNFNCMVKTLQKKFGDLNYSAEDMMTALNAAPKELRAITRGIWQIFEENKEAFQEVQNQIDGKVIKFVDPDAYTFDDGEVMEGGYYPAGTVAQIKDFADTQSAFRVDGVYASQSFQKDRDAGVHGDLDLTLNSLTAWNYKMASVLHVAVPYNNLGKLLRNERVAISLGEYRVRWLNEWMKMSTAPLKVSPFLAAVDGLASVKILGWAPARAFTQMSGIFPAMQQIGTKWVMKAIAQMGNPVHAIKKASTLSPYMQARYANPEEHLNLLLQSRQMFGVNVKQKLKKGFEYYTDVAMFSVIYGDAIASYTTWTAEFEKQKAAGLSDQEASALADSQVRLLQGDMSAGSRPKGMQGNMRFFTKFASYFIGISSLLRAKAARGAAWDIIAREAGLLTSVCLFGAAWESLWKTMSQWLWAEVTDDDDQKKKWAKKGINSPEDLFLSLAAENTASTFGSAIVPMYGIGNAAMTALTTGNLYDAKNMQLDWMYNFLGVAQIANSFFVDDEEKAVRVRKKGLKNILSSAMTDSAANKVTNILIGE